MSRIGFFTGICWSISFLITAYSLGKPGMGLAGEIIGLMSIWVAGIQLRTQNIRGTRRRWHRSLAVQLLAAVLCTFVQYIFFRYMDGGTFVQTILDFYGNPENKAVIEQQYPGVNVQEVLSAFSTIELSQLIMSFLIMNSLIAILLSIPTMFVARPRSGHKTM
ncbi:MAG: DUF4199 domain-containing protein [Bacteroidaceae bacterium]|jgi:hypothetical protein|nr:DUF4199 domain-containing protein [Bacteroidaceae bacterium]MBQ2073696.1 DUF4199 domain-containing protein [Bacteroidaceae bacterium]MBR0183405.1 DUF4199 domain-containing protein [Bacteroidaceae bacterium]